MNVAQYTDYTMIRPDRVSHTIMSITPEIAQAWQLYVDGKPISNIAVPIGGFANNYIPGPDPL